MFPLFYTGGNNWTVPVEQASQIVMMGGYVTIE
jgi:hypothetical protein